MATAGPVDQVGGPPKEPWIARFSLDCLLVTMRIANLINSIALMISCVFAFSIIKGSVTRFFLSIYIGLFGILLFIFEIRVKSCSEAAIRRYFGFMFSFVGRTGFLLFVGLINFGMISDSNKNTRGYSVVITVGVFTLVNAVFNCFVVCSHPAFKPAKSLAAGGRRPGELSKDEVMAYMRAHPELAREMGAPAGGAVAMHGVLPARRDVMFAPSDESIAVPVAAPLKPAPKQSGARGAAAAASAPAPTPAARKPAQDDNPFDSSPAAPAPATAALPLPVHVAAPVPAPRHGHSGTAAHNPPAHSDVEDNPFS